MIDTPSSARAVVERSRSDAPPRPCVSQALRRRRRSAEIRYSIHTNNTNTVRHVIDDPTSLLCKSTFPRGLVARASNPRALPACRGRRPVIPIDFVRKLIRYCRDIGEIARVTPVSEFAYPSVFLAVVIQLYKYFDKLRTITLRCKHQK